MNREKIKEIANRFEETHREEPWFVAASASRTNQGTGVPCLRICVKSQGDVEKVPTSVDDIQTEVTVASPGVIL